MNGDDYVEETCAKCYPVTQGATVHTANGVDVTLLQLQTIEHIAKRVLRLTSDSLSSPWIVTQLQLQSWKMYDQVYIDAPTYSQRLQKSFILDATSGRLQPDAVDGARGAGCHWRGKTPNNGLV